MLDIRRLVKHYPVPGGESVRAVDDVSLAVARGELVALYGPSGSGKTTLLKLIAAVMAPDSGEVVVAGRDITRLSDREAARYRLREVGFVLQTFHMIAGLSAIDNASLKLMGTGLHVHEAHQRMTPLLTRLGLDERADHQVGALSMGERQRVAIAKALSTDPGLLLADEPTGNLDTRRGREVLTLLSEICRERDTAVLLVTHDPQAAAFADRVIALCDGRLVEYAPDLQPGLPATLESQ
ncbi:MAG TPA: ABC transporter ATP-binding protein [Conexibacter sp.]|jgi:putative ABC transport system ATP-binding protein|nr:ABC transporter ATP-binding protein [Conexibacter sp.]